MFCPFCEISYHDVLEEEFPLSTPDPLGYWRIEVRKCPECKKINLTLICATPSDAGGLVRLYDKTRTLVYPRSTGRPPCSPDVPSEFAEDYIEACLVLADSPKASAALSRRCLQHLLREAAKVKPDDLSKEIDEMLARNTLPSHLSESLDAIRAIGNFAAHPIKSKSTGEIVPVEHGEAEWLLDLLEGMFDYYFVQPAKTAKKKSDLSKKLADSGELPLRP
jgi:hypothetical protein